MKSKLDGSKDLTNMFKHGKSDDATSVNKIKMLLDGITCHDLELLLACESFKPQVFASYLKLMNELGEIR